MRMDNLLPRLICGWCKATLRDGTEPTSHGICPSCASQLRDEETRPAWKASLGRLGKAQAIAWSRLTIQERNVILAQVDAEVGTADCGCVYHAEQGIPCEHDKATPTQQADGFKDTDFDGRTAEAHEEP